MIYDGNFFNSSDFRWLILSLKTPKTKILVRSQSLAICRSSILKLKFAVIASANSLNVSLRTILKFLSSCIFSRILSDVLMPDDFTLLLHTMSFVSSAISPQLNCRMMKLPPYLIPTFAMWIQGNLPIADILNSGQALKSGLNVYSQMRQSLLNYLPTADTS